MTQQVSSSPPREDSDSSMPENMRNVVSETNRQARQLLEQGMSELRGQARDGQRKVAGGLRGLADQLHTMSERTEASGMASDVARQVSEQASGAASWLESRDPGDLVNELRDLARRHPGMFLAGAALTGVLVGRLTRNMVAATKNDDAVVAPVRS